MIDLAGATKASTSNLQNKYLLSMGVNPLFAIQKASWNIAIQGAFALLYPMIHTNFANRIETTEWWAETNVAIAEYVTTVEEFYASTEIQFIAHTHPAPGGTTSPPLPPPSLYPPNPTLLVPNFMFIPDEQVIFTMSRPVPLPLDIKGTMASAIGDLLDIEQGMKTFEPIVAWAKSPVTFLLGA